MTNPLNAGLFSKSRFKCHLLFKTLKICLLLIGNESLSGKQAGSQASCRVTLRLAWIQHVCTSITKISPQKGLFVVFLRSPLKACSKWCCNFG